MNKILVADDSRLVTSLVKNIFQQEKEEYLIITAQDGKEALDKIFIESPDIILMDWQMPVMNGLEALDKLKSDIKTKDIPVIMLTASDNISIVFEKGATDYIQKPFEKDELIARVKSALTVINSRKDIKAKNIEIDIQREKLKMQKEILIKQKKEINENFALASSLQKGPLTNEETLKSFFHDFLILSLPKEKITNNFIWARKKDNTVFFAVGYCNKHGVPSVLINLYSANCLDDLFIKTDDPSLLQPASLLSTIQTKMDQLIGNSEITNNLPMAICALDLKENTLQYAGLNVPVYVIKNNKLVELKTDHIKQEKNHFVNHKVHLAPSDVLYILNDGFNEHTSISEDKNYLSNEISKLLLNIYKNKMLQQQQMLLKTFDSWKSDLKQVEDILVLGIKI